MDNFAGLYYENINNNPVIFSPNAEYGISFAETDESLQGNAEEFEKIVENAISAFRHSRLYKMYKSSLIELGLDRCQIMSNITIDMVEPKGIEMHHVISLHKIAIVVARQRLMKYGKITTFDLIYDLKEIHRKNKLPLVMLCKTLHQVYHDNDDFIIPSNMCFGKWHEFLFEYKYGITYGVAKSIQEFIRLSLEHNDDSNLNSELLKLNDELLSWAHYNEYGYIE